MSMSNLPLLHENLTYKNPNVNIICVCYHDGKKVRIELNKSIEL